MMFNLSNLKPKIYVVCLAADNCGYFHGTWIDADQSAEEIQEEIQAMLKDSPIGGAKEWGIYDYKDFGDITIEKYKSIETIAKLASFIAEQGELGAAVLNYTRNDLEEAKTLLEKYYEGEHEDEEDFVHQLLKSCYEIPDHLASYIDYEAVARDYFMDSYFSIEVDRKKHIFRNY